jgi:ABC-2 type transport system permease protein
MSRIEQLPATARRGVLAALITTVAVVVSGCGSADITRSRVEAAIAPTFSNLYALQRYQLGYLKVSGSKIPSRASCDRRGSVLAEGAGNNWLCTIVWQVAGPGTQATAVYNLTVQPDGCYSADGDSPLAINGKQTMVAFDGTSFLNPLWRFDGCFNNT